MKEEQTNMFTTLFNENISNPYYAPGYLQINNVRGLLNPCINSPCPIKVHSTEIKPTLWMKELGTVTQEEWVNPVTKEDFVQLLIEHGVLNEIKKAKLNDPNFNENFAMSLYEKVDTQSGFLLFKVINDLYTASKIVSQKMKSVIVYEHYTNAHNLINIFTELGYTKTQVRNRQCR